MKLLVVFLVVLFGVWLWRQGRLADRADTKPPTPRKPPALPNEMVRCAVCGLHLPATEAVSNGRVSFCSVEHQRQAE
ncbi:hypothetical protein RD110_22955 [Rhodoferax koreense]|uniref:Preprotein translocase subunit YajC n=1 Tax=Rhodoferax koreensis TaxID=1842727 RepID=A0A1P8K130_9BURK|nr:PP0621 family protein [Rhodoferax koreense]APW39706.1 hypothetical protein RD110_22955 [Rhodoferax koreense]